VVHDEGSIKVNQYAYFALKSETTPAETMTRQLGVEPDRISVRGSRLHHPPRPACHTWQIECRALGLPVDEQVTAILARVRPLADAIRTLLATGEVTAVLQVVRDFTTQTGEPEHPPGETTNTDTVLDALPGRQQHLLGWHLAAADLAFLVSIDADLDVDEYG
jgi:hypothetical protein